MKMLVLLMAPLGRLRRSQWGCFRLIPGGVRPGSFLLVLSVPLGFTFFKMLLKHWVTAQPLPVIREKERPLPAVVSCPQRSRQKREVDHHQAGQEGRRGVAVVPNCLGRRWFLLICCLDKLRSLSALLPQSHLPRLLPPRGHTGSEPGFEALGAFCQVFTVVH